MLKLITEPKHYNYYYYFCYHHLHVSYRYLFYQCFPFLIFLSISKTSLTQTNADSLPLKNHLMEDVS